MWPESEKTQEIITQVQTGDEDAVERLLARHRESVRRMISMRLDPMLQRRLDASDIVQDVLVEAHRRLENYLKNPSMPFHLWLRHLAKDHIIDAHRKHRKAAKRSVDKEKPINSPIFSDASSVNLAYQLVADGATPQAQLIQAELEQRFQLAMAELSDEDREIILMRHFEQLSNQDLAKAFNITEPAASMRYLRALKKLRKKLTPIDESGEIS